MGSNRIRISVSGNFHLAAEVLLRNQRGKNIYIYTHTYVFYVLRIIWILIKKVFSYNEIKPFIHLANTD